MYLFLLHQMGVALFRLMGALGREMNRTNMFGRYLLQSSLEHPGSQETATQTASSALHSQHPEAATACL